MAYEADVRVGDDVRVTGGPFAGSRGPVTAVDPDRGRVRLTVDVLGDPATVELHASDVEKAV
ncbi:KOW motif-containing protein [Kitasatospora sp. NPDC048722]|uniref:KOW motif-containing protein n=1 Tax=Kitasatospora sp. NPDC048722 TaxID=3155639 RepID=UPI003406D604